MINHDKRNMEASMTDGHCDDVTDERDTEDRRDDSG